MGAFTKDDLKRFQAMSLNDKFQLSLAKTAEWYSRWSNKVFVSFSGGKDSTVLADICAKWCKVIGQPLYLAFSNTGLEYPEIQKFVKEYAEYLRKKHGIEVALEIVRPEMRFDEVIKEYGYPVISKEVSCTIWYARRGSKWANNNLEGIDNDGRTHSYKKGLYVKYKPLVETDFLCSDKCCKVMKEKALDDYAKRTGRKTIVATMASESKKRETAWLQTGCNAFNGKKPMSKPMSFWTEQDVLQYIKAEKLPIASVYGDIVYAEDSEQMRIEDYGIDCGGKEKLRTTGCDRTGCIFCAFGCHLEKEPSRFQRLKETHPRQYDYCINGGEPDENGVWKPNKQGLGMGHVFDELNKIYGADFIKYK